ncbi:unnamed protein product [Ectocarpus sp. 12 AP-2014]
MGGHLGVVKALLAAGVNFEGTSTSLTTALHLAVAHGHMEVVNELMEAGANPNLRRARDGGMALALASSVGYTGDTPSIPRPNHQITSPYHTVCV